MSEIKKIDLGQLPVGVPVTFTTASGNEYTIVRVAGSRRDETWVTRVLLTSQRSSSVTQFGARFEKNFVHRFMEVGSVVSIYVDDGGRTYARTTPIRHIVVDEKYDGAVVRQQDTNES